MFQSFFSHSHSNMLRRCFNTCSRLSMPPRFVKQVGIIDKTDAALTKQPETPQNPSRVLEECKEDISYVAPYLKPTFNFAAYVNKSETLQQFVNLGVDLQKVEKIRDAAPFISSLDFERDVKNHIIFFIDLGISTEIIAEIFTKNPLILKEDVDTLKVRVNYLKMKRFSDEMIIRIVTKNPMWLSFSTQDIDEHLGFFQKDYNLTGHEVRGLATRCPKLITHSKSIVERSKFAFKEEMGFDPEGVKQILLTCPYLFMKREYMSVATFNYAHNILKIPHETFLEMPMILSCRVLRIKQRHLFLKKLGKVQFNPKKPNYISFLTMVSGTDAHFSTEVAGSSIQAYNAFLKMNSWQ